MGRQEAIGLGALKAFALFAESTGKQIIKKQNKVEDLYEKLLTDSSLMLKNPNFEVLQGTTLQQVRDAFIVDPKGPRSFQANQPIGENAVLGYQALYPEFAHLINKKSTLGFMEDLESEITRGARKDLLGEKLKDKLAARQQEWDKHVNDIRKFFAQEFIDNPDKVEAFVENAQGRFILDGLLAPLRLNVEKAKSQGFFKDLFADSPGIVPIDRGGVGGGEVKKKTKADRMAELADEGKSRDEILKTIRREFGGARQVGVPGLTETGTGDLRGALGAPSPTTGGVSTIPDPTGGRAEGLLKKASPRNRVKLFGLLNNASAGARRIKGQRNVSPAGATRF